MEIIINYFENISSLHRSILLVGGISFFWFIEGAIPLFNLNYQKWKHAIPNLFFTLTTIIINFFLAFLLVSASDLVVERNFGILSFFSNYPLVFKITIGILLLDFFGAYLAHYVEHRVKPLWMIHLVHHSDHNVDTTTANRHHPLESIIRFTFTLYGVVVVGAPIGYVMLYQSLSLIFSQFNHANIKLPKRVDKIISYVFVSPDMHKIHHHYMLPYTDSNYGNIFSFWDRLFGTFSFLNPSKIIYGVDTYFNEKDNQNIKSLLFRPFEKHKPPTN